MPELLTYYESLNRKKKGAVTRKLYIEGGFPYITFRQKLLKKSFTLAEEIAISQILNIDRSELFPTDPALQNKLSTI